MPKRRLDPETLTVETYATTPATAAPPAEGAGHSAVTSCPKPPYCTC